MYMWIICIFWAKKEKQIHTKVNIRENSVPRHFHLYRERIAFEHSWSKTCDIIISPYLLLSVFQWKTWVKKVDLAAFGVKNNYIPFVNGSFAAKTKRAKNLIASDICSGVVRKQHAIRARQMCSSVAAKLSARYRILLDNKVRLAPVGYYRSRSRYAFSCGVINN